MGLDQYAYVAARAGQNSEWWDGAELDPDTRDYRNSKLDKPRELAYWRKHPNLQGWMKQLWEEKNPDWELDHGFNGIELELTWADLERLELDVIAGTLPKTAGFFFGNDSDEEYRDQDLEFIRNAKAELFVGLKVFYNSSW